MKTFARIIMLTFAAGLIFGCAPNPVKTIENLKAAYNGESTASAKYAAFAEKAKAEGSGQHQNPNRSMQQIT
jgi:hypothetical protein